MVVVCLFHCLGVGEGERGNVCAVKVWCDHCHCRSPLLPCKCVRRGWWMRFLLLPSHCQVFHIIRDYRCGVGGVCRCGVWGW